MSMSRDIILRLGFIKPSTALNLRTCPRREITWSINKERLYVDIAVLERRRFGGKSGDGEKNGRAKSAEKTA